MLRPLLDYFHLMQLIAVMCDNLFIKQIDKEKKFK